MMVHIQNLRLVIRQKTVGGAYRQDELKEDMSKMLANATAGLKELKEGGFVSESTLYQFLTKVVAYSEDEYSAKHKIYYSFNQSFTHYLNSLTGGNYIIFNGFVDEEFDEQILDFDVYRYLGKEEIDKEEAYELIKQGKMVTIS